MKTRVHRSIALLLVSLLATGWARGEDTRPPKLFLIGDSTVRNDTGGFQGWGAALPQWVDQSKLQVVNRALGGRSSRTYLREGLWAKVLAELQSGDYVVMQFGHNDGGPLDEGKARASLKGSGAETTEVVLKETGQKEVVRTYGGYLRQYISDAKAKGAHPIVLAPVPRNMWTGDHVLRATEDYGKWARMTADEEGVPFIDLNGLIAVRYELTGREKVQAEYFTPADHTHTTPAGAQVNAACLVEGLLSLPGAPFAGMLRKPSSGQ